MKGILKYVICAVAATAMTHAIQAQELKSSTEKYNPRGPLTADTTIDKRMQKDLNTRNGITSDQTVLWKENGYGYYGAYVVNHVEYMARYDQNGKYVETLTKKEWNDSAPANLKSSYDQSSYKSQKVTGYWEVSNPERKGYYIELNDDRNQSTGIWADEDGKFSSSPSYVKFTPKRTKSKLLLQDSIPKRNR